MKLNDCAWTMSRLAQGIQHLLETVEGLVEASEALANSALAEMRGVQAGIGREGLIISRERFVQSPELLERVSFPKVRFSAGGTRLNGMVKTFQGLLRATRFQQGLSFFQRFLHLRRFAARGGARSRRRFAALPAAASRGRLALELKNSLLQPIQFFDRGHHCL